jgi:hypothetical protein
MCVCFVLYGAGFYLISFGPGESDQSREQPADKQQKRKNKPKHISSHLLGEKQMLDYHLQEDNK